MKKCANAMVLLAFSFGATMVVADTFKWVDSTSATADWRDETRWTDAAGQPVAAPPLNDASQAAEFGPLADALVAQEISLAAREASAGGWDWQECVLPSMSQGDVTAARRTVDANAYHTSVGDYGVWLTVQDVVAPDFLWKFATGQIGFRMPSTSTRTLALSHVSAKNRLDVSVPTVGTKATVETVHEGGAIVKRGAGELEVKGTTGSDTFFHVAEGTLTLDGRVASDEGDDVPVPGAWLHLDADRVDTMKWYAGDDGRTYVTNWADVRGNGAYAYYDAAWKRAASQTYLTDTTHAPFLNSTLVDGRSVMDFGRAKPTQDESLGPVACVMTLCRAGANVREVFCSMGLTYRADGVELYEVPVFSSDAYPFLPTRNKIVADNNAHTHEAAYGDILVDGVRKSNKADWPQSFGVVSIGLTNGVTVASLANDRMYNERVGGIRIGEILIFTNTLTHVQRLAVHRYLQRKWTLRDALEDQDAGAATFASNATAVSVPAGRSATIGEATAIGGTLVKTGEGDLTVGALAGKMGATDVSVDVRGGSVAFGGLEPVTADEPAEGAYVWLDANRKDTFVWADEAAATVSEWHDVRASQTIVYAKKPVGCYDYIEGGKLPVRVENALGDLCAVDFGAYSKSNTDSAFMMLDSVYTPKIYEAFIVQAYTSADATIGNIFGSSSLVALMKSSATALLPTSYGLPSGRGALWTVNGAVTDPMADGAVKFEAGAFNVVSVSTSEKVCVDLLGAKDRLNQGSAWGGVRTGEFIVYDRRLTPAERRQTIAYLMKRWRGVTPSYAQGGVAKVASMKFAADAPAVLNAASDLKVGSVDGANGNLVKTGAGTLAVDEELYGKTMAGISVEEGRLELKGGSPLAGILSKTAFHFDASDLESMTRNVSETMDGVVTNVTAIADQRVAGLAANAWKNPTQVSPNPISFADPTLRTVETVDGVFRTVIDFGDQNVHDKYLNKDGSVRYPTNFNASAMRFSTTFDNIREAHTIFRDSDKDGRRSVTIFSDDSQYHYLRGDNGVLLSGNARTEVVRNGYIAVDGTEVAYSSVLPAGFHLVSAAPTADTSLGAIGADRNCVAGGCQVGEFLGFTTALSPDERDILQAHLMAKWLGTAEPGWTNSVASVSVAAGSALSLGANDSLRVSALEGEGTVELDRLIADGTLSLTFDHPLTVGGCFVQDGTLEVSVSGIPAKPEVGVYPILSATSFENLNLSLWTLSTPAPHGRILSFVSQGGMVCLKVEKTGGLLIVR